tara:strand:- start:5192 stop:6421 length:1230 start_codon:yes stop_codon:yes gene_type:complete
MKLLTTFFTLSLTLLTLSVSAESNWTQWRGTHGNGLSTASHVPESFSSDNVVWKTEVPGVGQSSPIFWEDSIFLSSATDRGNKRVVVAIDRKTGEIQWQTVVWEGEAEDTHSMNNRASSTCATDGKRVVAFFGKGGLHSLDTKTGKVLWSRDLGKFEGPWGTGASPVIVDGLVVQNCDADNESSLMAFNLETGKTVWKTSRETIRGWSTPVVFQSTDRKELILNGHSKVVSYNIANGDVYWECIASVGRGTPTLAFSKDAVISVPGRSGTMVAIRPGGSGDVSGKQEAWRVPRTGGRDLPSPLVVGNYLIVTRLRPGIISCYDNRNGEQLWQQRVEGGFSSSPIAINGTVYTVTESGITHVFKPGASFEAISKNSIEATLEETFRASPAAFDGHLLLRSDKYLYCIGQK